MLRSPRPMLRQAHSPGDATNGQMPSLREYFAALNANAFNGTLPANMELRWNGRLRLTAGRCHFTLLPDGARSAQIELSSKVCKTPEQLQLTLAHEMCHAAQWVLDGSSRPPHGVVFRRWARRVEERCPDITVSKLHQFEVHRRPTPPFATFVRTEYAALRRRWPHVSHGRVMEELGRRWKSKTRSKRRGAEASNANAPETAAGKRKRRTRISDITISEP